MTRTTNAIFAAALTTTVALVLAASASAGSYLATQCDSSFGVDLDPTAFSWDQTETGRYQEENWCFAEATGGGLVVYHPDTGAVRGGVAAGWTIPAPTDTRFSAIEVLASGAQGDGNEYISELYAEGPRPAPYISNQPTYFADATGGAESVKRWQEGQVGGNGSAFTLAVRCIVRLSETCGPGNGNFINVRRIKLTIADDVPPQVTDAGSSLASQSSLRGTLSASYGASDRGAGIRTVTAEVNGQQVRTADQSCSVTSGRAVRLVPCPLSPSGSIPLDTTQPPWQQGLNQTRFCATEYADSNAATRCSVGPDVRVDNQCPVVGTQGIVGFEQLGFVGGKAGDGRTTYGQNVKLTGRAVNSADQPVAGAQLCLGERVALGPYMPETIVRSATTNAKGRFAIGLPNGPSREFRLAQWQTSGGVVEQFASLQVKAKPRLAVRPKGKIREGKKTRLRVKVNRPFAPGQAVEIQARAPTGFVGLPGCSGQVDADGRFTCRDRIPATPGEAAYSLHYRAVAPHVEGSAYLPGNSKVVKKRVKG